MILLLTNDWMAPTHKCTQEANISFITKAYADMDKKIDTVILAQKETQWEIKEMRKEIKETYATKEELTATANLQELKNTTMSKDIEKVSDTITKLWWVVVLAVVWSILTQVIK